MLKDTASENCYTLNMMTENMVLLSFNLVSVRFVTSRTHIYVSATA